MARLTELFGQRVFLDTNIVVYIIEGFPAFERHLRQLLAGSDDGRLVTVLSELALAETLVKPLEAKRTDLAAAYERFISPGTGREIVSVTRDVLRAAAEIRANLNVKLPDAVHVASALAARCDTFLTNDLAMRCPPGLRLVQLSSLSM